MLVVAMTALFLQILFSKAQSSSLATASTPEVISSRTKTSGSLMRVHAMVNRRFQPPESSLDLLCRC